MNTVAIIQARMASSRLPGKVMKILGGQTVLGHVITRVRACLSLDEVIVATTLASHDKIIIEECAKYSVRTFRGSEDDVLSRYYHAAREIGPDLVVRVTSDCPLFDPQVLEDMLRAYYRRQEAGQAVDYLSNTLERTFPRGLDAEIFTFTALEKAHHAATKLYEREHVTPYLYLHPELFSLEVFCNPVDLSHHRWTLDPQEDWTFIEAIYRALYREGNLFSTQEVLELLEAQPELMAINAHVRQKKLGE